MIRPKPNPFQVWLRAVRALSLTTTIIPVLLGGGFAMIDRGFDGWTFLLTMVAAMLLQAGTNLFNDYFDHLKGADASGSLSPSGALQQGWLTLRHVYVGGWVCFALTVLLGVFLVLKGGWPILLLGLLGLAGGYLYTGTRFAFAYHALGEVTAFLLLGPLMVFGTYYVMVKMFFWSVVLGAIPIGLLTAAILHANNLRDLEHDRLIGKKTLATLLGWEKARWEYYLLLMAAYVAPLVLVLLKMTPWTVLLTLLTLPLAIKLVRTVKHTHDPMELNLVLGLTVLLQLLFGILNVFGVFLYYFLEL
ncbi:MAG TPA: 1,4-dihydroxy-2-naphthoate octaprenyltransferase [Bacilli bacterium]|nr:1,4-dihydroxy-2-naphthoate octaprenyltransferase [Bacilli bacterium]